MIRLVSLVVLAVALLSVTPSAQADLIIYTAFLDGPSEAPPNASPGSGFATVGYDPDTKFLAITAFFTDLVGTTTAAHIHAPTAIAGTGTAGVATMVPSFTGFPLGVTSGAWGMSFDTTSAATYNPAFITANGGTVAGAEAALLASLADGKAYLNIHTSAYPAGEIRGFLTAVPEPSTLVMWGLGGVLGLAGCRWRNRKLSRS